MIDFDASDGVPQPVQRDGIDLRCGDWRSVLADVECDALICDPPYGARTHEGHDRQVRSLVQCGSTVMRRDLSYKCFSADDVRAFIAAWSPRVNGWMAVMSCSDLSHVWRAAFADVGRYAFAPVPCVIRGMSVRMSGDGPSSWAVYLNVARPRTKAAGSWGTLPGAYVVTAGARIADEIAGARVVADNGRHELDGYWRCRRKPWPPFRGCRD